MFAMVKWVTTIVGDAYGKWEKEQTIASVTLHKKAKSDKNVHYINAKTLGCTQDINTVEIKTTHDVL